MHENWLELAIIAFIVLGIGFVVFRTGAANPESTGAIGKQLRTLQKDVSSVKSEVSAVKDEMGGIDRRVTEIDRRTATTDDIRGIEKKLDEHGKCLAQLDDAQTRIREEAAARHAKLDSIGDQVGLIYSVIVPKGMS